MSSQFQPQDFEAVRKRLEEIADAVDDESLSLDDALDLFEEAVSLGLKASDYIEEGVVVDDAAVASDETGFEPDGVDAPQAQVDESRFLDASEEPRPDADAAPSE